MSLCIHENKFQIFARSATLNLRACANRILDNLNYLHNFLKHDFVNLLKHDIIYYTNWFKLALSYFILCCFQTTLDSRFTLMYNFAIQIFARPQTSKFCAVCYR